MEQCNCGRKEDKAPWVISTENYDFDLSNILLIIMIIVIVWLLNREC